MELIEELRRLLGATQVLCGADAARYGRDWTGQYEWTPLAVLRPGSTAEVSAVMRLAHAARVPVVPVSGHTGLTGGTVAEGALMLSLERMNRIREIRRSARTAVVEAGVVLATLHEEVGKLGLSFPLMFGARGSAMIGGALSTNAGGSNVLRYGNTRALCLGLEVVLADGRILDLQSALHKDNSGYDLRDLFIGAEGTLGIITGAVLKLVPAPRAYATAMVATADLGVALDLLNRLQEATAGLVEAFEYMPRAYMRRLLARKPEMRAPFAQEHDVNILVEIASTSPRDAHPREDGSIPLVTLLEETLFDLAESGAVLDAVVARSDAQRSEMWARREAAAEITLGQSPIVDTDVAVPLDLVARFETEVRVRIAALDPQAETLSIAHLGDGNLHFTIFPTDGDPVFKDRLRETVEDVVALLGGSFSAEHGIGTSKKPTMARRKDPVVLEVMRSLRKALDPEGILNPGKVLPD
ncbi:FAD-binding oxidoreductase [Plastorhodobacter daqingensis]|uniref:FAD-binding oxidoreductase n=1 Tax=Plastorhodobacter daqingensis TaxID=1387281 RepID=A0ABW2UPB8_9RHOB